MKVQFREILRAALWTALSMIVISCGDSPGTSVEPQLARVRRLAIHMVSGNAQTGVINTVLPESLVVQLRDRNRAVAGVQIEWSVTSGGGVVSPVFDTTDANGFAKAAWTLGPAAGPGAVEATAAGVGKVTFTATSTSEVPAGVQRVEITPSTVTLDGAGAQTTLVAQAFDANGNVITSQTFSWSSLNINIATVDRSGGVTAIAAGTAMIVALAGNVADTAQVTVAASTGSSAGTYYVSTSGSDASSGTHAAPWRTIGFAITRLQPGQTLFVRGGTYQENIKSPTIQPGRPDARIRVAAYPGERPVLQGLLWLNRPSYWTIDGINVTWWSVNLPTDHMVKMTNGVGWIYENAEVWGARSFAGILVYGSITGEPANWIIRGNCVHDIWTDPIHHGNGDHNLYINTGISAGAGLIERNILFNAPNGQNVKLGIGRSDPQPEDGTANVTVRYNTMYSSLKPILVADASHNNTIEKNIFQYSSEGYAFRAYRLTGLNNVFRNNVFFQFNRLQYGDSGYKLLTDGGGNLFPHDPKFDAVGCKAFRPGDAVAQSYGRYGN